MFRESNNSYNAISVIYLVIDNHNTNSDSLLHDRTIKLIDITGYSIAIRLISAADEMCKTMFIRQTLYSLNSRQ